jgi:hypothetical protein
MRTSCLLLIATLSLLLLGCTKEQTNSNTEIQVTKSSHSMQATDADLLSLARNGDLAAIMKITGHHAYPDGYYDRGPETDGDKDAYKWMLVTRDFGHTKSNAVIDDLLELSSLRYDDGKLVTSHISYELGLAYLMGTNGLPTDYSKADQHLRNGFAGVSGLDIDLELDREKLTGRAREVFDLAIPTQKKKRVR